MLRPQLRQPQLSCGARQLHQRRIAFTHRDHVLAFNGWQQFAEAPYPADIFRQRSRSALFPNFAQAQSKLPWRPSQMWIDNLQQLMTLCAAEHSVRRGLHHAAVNALQLMSGAGLRGFNGIVRFGC